MFWGLWVVNDFAVRVADHAAVRVIIEDFGEWSYGLRYWHSGCGWLCSSDCRQCRCPGYNRETWWNSVRPIRIRIVNKELMIGNSYQWSVVSKSGYATVHNTTLYFGESETRLKQWSQGFSGTANPKLKWKRRAQSSGGTFTPKLQWNRRPEAPVGQFLEFQYVGTCSFSSTPGSSKYHVNIMR